MPKLDCKILCKNAAQQAEIRKEFFAKKTTKTALARKHGISVRTLNKILGSASKQEGVSSAASSEATIKELKDKIALLEKEISKITKLEKEISTICSKIPSAESIGDKINSAVDEAMNSLAISISSEAQSWICNPYGSKERYVSVSLTYKEMEISSDSCRSAES